MRPRHCRRRRNPGTGKTPVAQLYARILGDLGLLAKGEVVLKTASDFVGSFLGASETQTRSIVEVSRGCVLVRRSGSLPAHP